MSRVCFRVDASQRIGTGHLRRCLALARQMERCGARPEIVTRDLGLGEWARGVLRQAGIAHAVLPAPAAPESAAENRPAPHADWAETGWQEDAAQFAAALGAEPADWVVLDHYAFDSRWIDRVRDKTGARIAAVDDLADRPLSCDVAIDHNWHGDHSAKYAGLLQPGAVLLGGPRFALIGDEYAQAAPMEFSAEVNSLGIFMGGSDTANASAGALLAVRDSGFGGPVEVVTTSANPHLTRLAELCAADGHAALTVDLPDLAAFFARHDLQIGAGGGATWERLCLGAPSILAPLAANQSAVLDMLAGADAAAVLDGDWTRADLADAIARLIADPAARRRFHDAGVQMVDGRGAQRAALAMLGGGLTLRDAAADDCANAFAWRNAPSVRSVSRDSSPIAWEDHRRWFAQTLASPERRLFAGQVGDVPVGFIRLDRLDGARQEVSFYLDPGLEGLGLGTRLLDAARAQAGAGQTIVGEVLPGNPASGRLFEKLGYTQVKAGRWELSAGSKAP